MSDLRRQILEEVRAGTLSPDEAAERLEQLGREPRPGESDAPRPGEPVGPIRRVRVVGDFRTAKIVGDPEVTGAVAEGPHTARHEGDTLVIDASGGVIGDEDFEFRSGKGPRVTLGLGSRPKPVSVRMNPDLPLEVEIDAGTVSIKDVRAPIKGDVDAGTIKIEGSASPFDLSVDAGSINIEGLLDRGDSRIRCDAGSIKVKLLRGSSVRVRARADVGAVTLGKGETARGFHIGSGEREATFGDGAATLEISGSLGRIYVDEA